MGLEKLTSLSIAAHFHLFQLAFLPLVHCDGTHKAEMDTEASMLSRAFEADKDAISDTCPLRAWRVALKTSL